MTLSYSAAIITAMDVTIVLVALISAVSGLVAGVAMTRSQHTALSAERDTLYVERDTLRGERTEANERARLAELQLARAEAELSHERAAAGQLTALIDRSEERLREAFVALSTDALRRNSESLAELAESRLRHATTDVKGELAQQQQAIAHLIRPMSENLDKFQSHVYQVEKDREGSYHALRQQISGMREVSEQLRSETSQLVTALRSPQQRGRWGEMQLRQIVEAAGMVEHCDFDEQVTVKDDDGPLRPDLVVHLAGDKHVVVDSKVSFIAYLEALQATDETSRRSRLSAHARHVRDHIDDLAKKAYWEQFDPSPEFVVCFVPAEVFLNAAVDHDPTLYEYAFERNVVIATPQTLIALLRTIAYGWRQEALAKNAKQVHALARELFTRIAKLGGHMDGVGKALNSAVSKYNDAVGSLERRVLVTARKFNDLRVVDADLEAPDPVESLARPVQAPELTSNGLGVETAADQPAPD